MRSTAASARSRKHPEDSDNLVPVMLDAIRAEATVGEVCGVLLEVFGDYREPAIF